jgi:hypothetical protein
MPDDPVDTRVNETSIPPRLGDRRHGASEIHDAADSEGEAPAEEDDTEDRSDEPQRFRPIRSERPARGRDKHEEDALRKDPSLAPRSERRQMAHGDMLFTGSTGGLRSCAMVRRWSAIAD